jgi:RHS repeat-associated protein
VLDARCSTTEKTPWAVPFRVGDPHKIPIDPNGNLTSKTEGTDSWTYTWNAENQLVKVEKNGAEVARFSYDAVGRRVESAAAGVTTSYAYDSYDIVREVRGGTTLKYVYGLRIDEPFATDDGTAITYFHSDALGSIAKTTSSAGAEITARQYDAWGRLQAGATSSGYAFTAREWSPESELYYYRARYYDPKAGRFISADPIDLEAGPNVYLYADNEPVARTDPYGLDWREAMREKQAGWPLDPITPRAEGWQRWPNPRGGPTRDRQRHCFYSCIQMRRNGPQFAWWIPFDTVRQFGGAALGQRTWAEAGGDWAADWWGAWSSLDPTKTCEEQCNKCPTNK